MTTTNIFVKRAGGVFVLAVFLLVPMSSSLDIEAPIQADIATPPVPSPQGSGPLSPTTMASGYSFPPTDGEIFDALECNYFEKDPAKQEGPRYYRHRPNLRVGINNHGSIGMGPADPSTSLGTGFQMPVGTANENLAVGWWGEGYHISWTGGPDSYFYPSDGPNGPITRIDDFYLDSNRYTTYRVTVDLGSYEKDGPLLVDFEWTLDHERCDLTLRTVFENQGTLPVDIGYKRVVDWDNLDSGLPPGVGSFYQADWRHDGRGAYSQRSVGGIPHYECSTVTLGSYLPDIIDLYAWDDLYMPGDGYNPGSTYVGDGNAAFHFHRDSLAPGGKWTTFLQYQCEFLYPCIIDIDIERPIADIEALKELIARTAGADGDAA